MPKRSAAGFRKWVDRCLSICTRQLGLRVTADTQKSHRLIVGILNGRPFQWRVATSPSDINACRSARRDLVASLRSCGIEEPPAFGIGYLTFPTPEEDAIDALFRHLRSLDDPERG